jgi:hypothetical protein
MFWFLNKTWIKHFLDQFEVLLTANFFFVLGFKSFVDHGVINLIVMVWPQDSVVVEGVPTWV